MLPYISIFTFLAAAIGVDARTAGNIPQAFKPHFFRAPLDHFNESDPRTFNNRYFVNDTYYRPDGPVFLYDSGEIGLTPSTVAQILVEMGAESSIMELAKRHHGLAIAWEHRYFGQSLPFPFELKNGSAVDLDGCVQYGQCLNRPINSSTSYKWLTIDQALEDVILFANNFQLKDLDHNLTAGSTPWIFIGSSYPGSRAAFARLRSPETFYASWASSAVIKSRDDGSAYFNTMQRAMPESCKSDFHAAIKYMDEILDGNHGKKTYSNLEKLIYVAKKNYRKGRPG